MPTEDKEWATLYQKLLVLLKSIGENDYLGGKDYWIVDDDWGARQHKIYIHNPTILTPEIVNKIQRLLRDVSPGWQILIEIDVLNCPNEGIVVAVSSIEYHWNLSVLRNCLTLPDFFE